MFDYESDLRNPRKSADSLEGGVLNPSDHAFIQRSAALSTAFVLLCSLSSILTAQPGVSTFSSSRGFLLTTVLLILSWTYSAPPIRFKERPVLDSLSNGAIVWLCWAIGYVASGQPLFGPDAQEGAGKGWLLAFCTTGVHALGAAADLEADVAAGQQTIATLLGIRMTALFSTMC